LARKYSAELILFTVEQELRPVMNAELSAYARIEHITAAELGAAAAKHILVDAERRATAKGAVRISTEAGSGDPAEEIIGTAKSRKVDLIVMGSRGHGRLAGLLLGSVAQKVLAHAPCSVLVVR
jgi:nucleotide-binding universal stress UspA family protein